MIPTQEWKFFEGTEQRLKHLARHRHENVLAFLGGTPAPWDPGELAARQAGILQDMDYAARVEAALGQDPTPQQARHLELHRRGVLQALFETHPDLFPLMQSVRESMTGFSMELNGRALTYAERARLLRDEPDRDLREAAYLAPARLGETVLPDLVELLRRREMLARTVADSGYPAVATYVQEMDRSESVGLVDAFERYTRTAYGAIRTALSRELGIVDLEPWDLAYGLAQRLGAPATNATEAAHAQAKRWGWPLAAVTATTDPGLKLPVWVTARDAPDDIVLVHRGEATGWTETLRGWGAAAHLSASRSGRFYLEDPAPVLREASGWLLAGATREPGWWEGHENAPQPLERYLETRRWSDLLLLREYAAHTAFENLIYAESKLDPHRLYCDVMEHLLQVTRRRTPHWAADALWGVPPFSKSAALLGAMVAAATAEHLSDTFGAYWERAEAGSWVLERFQKIGSTAPWETLVEDELGCRLELEPLARALGVSYTGPTMEESEGLSDEAVDDYFKDIDLTDLDLD